MSEVHIFDFDGTLFYSPAPTRSAAASLLPPLTDPPATSSDAPAASAPPQVFASAAEGQPQPAPASKTPEELHEAEANKLYGSLLNPVDSGGYGWFQSLHTMSPPFVPETPQPEVWFVTPILAHMRALVERRNALLKNSGGKAVDVPLLYVLTGRDVKYYDRIWTLLQQVGLDKEVEDVILKPHETAGTVTYKLNNFFKIIQYHCPSRVFYYEDRVEQGGKLLEGIRVLEEVLYYNQYGATSAADRVGVVTFDVTAPSTTSTAGAPTASASTLNQGSASRVRPHDDALHTPQPQVLFQFGAHRAERLLSLAEADPRHASLTSTLRCSPYALLRDACYPLDRIAAFYQHEADITDEKAKKAAEQAERQAQRWVEGTVEFWNAKNAPGRGGSRGNGRGGRGGGASAHKSGGKSSSSGSGKAKFDAKALHDAIHFDVAPSFSFVMVLVPAALCDRSNYMLDKTQFAALVEKLKEAREERVGSTAAA